MAIEYRPGLFPGQKIDLSPFEKPRREPRPESYLPLLRQELESLKRGINRQYGDFLLPDGKINLVGPEAEKHQELVDAQEEGWSREARRTRADWLRERDRNPAEIAEMALTVVFHKILGERFIVCRASKYDDYNNGLDQLLIDKESGDVLCGFDEVLSGSGQDGGLKKEGKMKRIREKGGASLEYGAAIEQGKLVRQSLKNVPAFYLALDKKELLALLEAIKADEEKVSPAEAVIFGKLLISLEEQAAAAGGNWALKAKTNLVLEKLKDSLVSRAAA